MNGDLGLEPMNSNIPKLRWKSVKKGRSARSLGRRTNSASQLGDFVGSDFDKVSEGLLGQAGSSMLDSVPIKKRRHLLCKDSVALLSSSFEESGSFTYPRCSSEDFSGMELLAAAASMDGDSHNSDKEMLTYEGSSLKLLASDSSHGVLPPEICLKRNKGGDSSRKMIANEGNGDFSVIPNDSACASPSLTGTQVGVLSETSRRKHWDLNILMDAWDEPHDSVAASKDCSGAADIKTVAVDSSAINTSVNTSPEACNLKLDENNSATPSPDKGGIDFSSMGVQHYLPITATADSQTNTGTADNQTKTGTADNQTKTGTADNQTKTASADNETKSAGDNFRETTDDEYMLHDSHTKTDIDTMIADGKRDWSISSEPCCTSSTSVPDGKLINGDLHKDGICLSNLTGCLKAGNSENKQSATEDGISLGKSELADLQCQNSCIFVEEGISLLVDNSHTSVRNSSVETGSQSHSLISEFGHHHEGKNYTPEVSKNCIMDRLSKDIIPRSDPLLVNGIIDSASVDPQIYDISKAQHAPLLGDSLTVTKEAHDSLYEDGELRGSCMYSWEENECADYESDGRNENDADMDDCGVSQLAEGGSEVSHGVEGRNLTAIGYEGQETKSGHDEHTPTRNFSIDEFDNDVRVGKGSNAGSGMTIEQSMENIEEKYDSKDRRLLTGSSDAGVKIGVMNQYPSDGSRRKLRLRSDGIAPVDTGDVNGSRVTQSFRSNLRGSSYSHTEGGARFDKHVGWRNSASRARGEAEWSSWASRMRGNSEYEFHTETFGLKKSRNTGRIGRRQDYFDYRPTDNSQRRLLRPPSTERKDYACVQKGRLLTREAGNFRGHGRYLHHSDRGLEDFVFHRGEPGAPTSSRRDQSFSPNSSRSSQIHMQRRAPSKSRSRSPWHRRQTRSPDPRSQDRVHRRTRMPFFKRTFESSYEEDYISASRGRLHSQDNHRYLEDPAYRKDHPKRRSPVRIFRQPQRFANIHAPKEWESSECYRPVFHTRRFTSPPSSKGRKLGRDYSDRRREGGDRGPR